MSPTDMRKEMLGYLHQKNLSTTENKQEELNIEKKKLELQKVELDLRKEEFNLSKARFDLDKKEREQRLEIEQQRFVNERDERNAMLDLMKTVVSLCKKD